MKLCIFVCTKHSRLGIADRALTHVDRAMKDAESLEELLASPVKLN
jgi:hypothetical protein